MSNPTAAYNPIPISTFERYVDPGDATGQTLKQSGLDQQLLADIDTALSLFRLRAPKYTALRKYYAGKHPLAFATAKFREAFGSLFKQFADNLLPSVVQAPVDRLFVSGFTIEDDDSEEDGMVAAAKAAAIAKVQKKYDAMQQAQQPAPAPTDGTDPAAAPAAPPAPDLTAQQAAETDEEVAAAVKQAQTELITKRAGRIWNNNNMNFRQMQLFREAVAIGDAWCIIWPNAAGKARFFPQEAQQCCISYSEEEPGEKNFGAKQWCETRSVNGRTQQYIRLNLYYPDSIVKLVTRTGTEVKANTALPDKAQAFALYSDDQGGPVEKNPWGVVPMFHFANDAGMNGYGFSEYIEAIPLQDALNKSVLDMMVAMEFASYPQRWATGVETDTDSSGNSTNAPLAMGVNRIMKIASALAKVGQFATADLPQFLQVSDGLRLEMARTTGTPLHYMMLHSTANISGDTMKALDARLVKKAETKQVNFGSVIASMMEFAMLVEGYDDGSIQLSTQWKPAESVSQKEVAETVLLRKEAGVDDVTALEELGFGVTEAEAMVEKKNAAAKAQATASMAAFNAGGPGTGAAYPGAQPVAANVAEPRVN